MITIEELKDLLSKTRRIIAWNIKDITNDSYELYFIRQGLDMNREINGNDIYVTIFTSVDNMMGSSTFHVYPSMEYDDVKDLLNEHIEISRLTLSDSYKLPRHEELKPVLKPYSFGNLSIKDSAFQAADALFEADKFDNGYINSAEVFINYVQTKYYDSSNNYYVFSTQFGKIEFVATWVENKKEFELYKCFEFDRLDQEYIRTIGNKTLFEAGERSKAIKLPEVEKCKLLIQDEDVKYYFENIANLANCDYIYNHQSKLQAQQDIHDKSNDCDRITMRLEPTLKYSTRGKNFDNDGIPLRKLQIFDKGIAKNFWGSNAKSQYLKKPVHGIYENYVVDAGTLTDEDLENETYLEIVSFSQFFIDLVTGDFGSEIRLGYLHQKNKEKIIVTGGSVSGNLYESLKTIRLSNIVEQNNNYLGPKYILLSDVTINKGE